MDLIEQVSVETVFIHWILQYTCNSNYELAVLSNVATTWRYAVLTFLRDMLTDGSTTTRNTIHHHQPTPYKFTLISHLLLPEMALELSRRSANQIYSHDNGEGIDSRPTYYGRGENRNSSYEPTFCLAWFSPNGIQTLNISDDAQSDSDINSASSDESCINSTISCNSHEQVRPISSLGIPSLDKRDIVNHRFLYQRELRKIADIKMKRSTSAMLKTVSFEWQGYRNPIDVLIPFGYTSSFIRDVLHCASNGSLNKSSNCKNDKTPIVYKETNLSSFAVRGSTLARPRGFCLCWDKELGQRTDLKSWNSDQQDSIDEYRRKRFLSSKLKKIKKKKLSAMKEYLPRVVMSTPVKNPYYQGKNGFLKGKRQRSLQFLNASGTRATYLRTPPFDCGPVIEGPVTIFCVGIATEDGCFVSGLKHRCELGHLYSNNSLDASIDMSHICLATEGHDGTERYPTEKCNSPYDSDSSNEIEQKVEQGATNCKFCSTLKSSESDSSDDSGGDASNEFNIIRGEIGPGLWHCYTAIFDGKHSIIRIDGEQETITQGESAHDSILNHPLVLDGLTIGSDHCFEMSLCFGEGSEGEGEGSISELAVFKGRLCTLDLIQMEDYLMSKHGIIHGHKTKQVDDLLSGTCSSYYGSRANNEYQESQFHQIKTDDRLQIDRFRRDSHALMVKSAPFELKSPVPLSMLAKHRSVAWIQNNTVTGKPVEVKRIGSKPSTGSSDW